MAWRKTGVATLLVLLVGCGGGPTDSDGAVASGTTVTAADLAPPTTGAPEAEGSDTPAVQEVEDDMTPSPTAPPVQDETNESEETDKPESGVARPESDSGPPAVPNQDGTEVADAEATTDGDRETLPEPGLPPEGWDPSVLLNTPGPVTQCLDTGLGGSRAMAMGRGEMWPTERDLAIINYCLTAGAGPQGGGNPDGPPPDGPPPADSPTTGNQPTDSQFGSGASQPPQGWDPSVFSNTPGPVTQCLDTGLGGSRAMAMGRGEMWPTERDLAIINYCLTAGVGPQGGGNPDGPPPDEPPPDDGPPPDDSFPCNSEDLTLDFVDLGWPITYETPGLPAGLTPLVDGMDQGIKFIADPTSMLLEDRRVRLFFEGDGERSWLSTTPAQTPYGILQFIPDTPYQLLGGDGRARHDLAWRRIIPLEDGRHRMFARTPSSIFSFVSDDGVVFSQEPGTRLSLENLGLTSFRGYEIGFGGYDIVATDTGWRIYVDYQLGFGADGSSPSNEDRDDFTSRIHSASSTDMLTWTVDSGERVGANSGVRGFTDADRDRGDGGPLRTPARISLSSVERRPSGDYLLVFTVGDSACALISSDGLGFSGWSHPVEAGVGDQDKLHVGNGEYLLFGTKSEFGIPMGYLRLD